MRRNNTKQVLLSIIGIAILVVAVVGVSFAFFTYSKTGEKNNVITTGNIEFTFEDATNNVIVENEFPKTALEAKSNTPFVFSVKGTVPSDTAQIKYEVYAIKGDDSSSITEIETGQKAKTRFKDNEIKLYLTGRSSDDTELSGNDGINIESTYQNIEEGGVAGNSETGFKIASGMIENDGKQHTHTYSLTMWVSDTVTISDTDYSKTYRASSIDDGSSPPKCSEESLEIEPTTCLKNKETDDRTVYSDLYYSLKIKVVAGDAIGKIFKNNP